MSTVKGLKLLRNLQFGMAGLFMKGEYIGDIPKELLDEFKSGSPYIEELTNIPSISASAPAQSGPKETAELKTVEQTKVAPKKPLPPKESAKTTRIQKTSAKK